MIKDSKSAESLAKILSEALPYIQKFSGKIVVIKYGGSAMKESKLRQNFARDIALMRQIGIFPVLVHGGGPQIERNLKKSNIKSVFIDGLRKTDENSIKIIIKTLREVNGDIAELIKTWGAKTKTFNDVRESILICRKIKTKMNLGFVGDITKVDGNLIKKNIFNGKIPVIAPIGRDRFGMHYNINADHVACKVAEKLRAEKIIMMTDVKGVLTNTGKKISEMNIKKAKKIAKNIKGGMLPKLSSVIKSLESGVKSAHIVDGRVPHAVLVEILTDKGVGTWITK
ncbi:MAG: acetylglutamate kinase [Gammaproteobacteria bacterium]|tara:strand:+ start:324 stop:1175 length:852 start_codon:yes stop_codon:yes gene_type:complete